MPTVIFVHMTTQKNVGIKKTLIDLLFPSLSQFLFLPHNPPPPLRRSHFLAYAQAFFFLLLVEVVVRSSPFLPSSSNSSKACRHCGSSMSFSWFMLYSIYPWLTVDSIKIVGGAWSQASISASIRVCSMLCWGIDSYLSIF